MRKLIQLVLLSLLAAASAAAQPIEFDRFLLPIYASDPISGAFGSLWVTEAIVTNTGDSSAEIDNVGTFCQVGCPNVPIPPGVSLPLTFLGLEMTVIPGRFVNVQRGRPVSIQLRVRDLSASTVNWGAELPVVPASRTAATVHLTGIPLTQQYRQMLRVYDFSQSAREVNVRVFDVDPRPGIEWTTRGSDPLLAEFTALMTRGASDQPHYAQIGDLPIIAAASRHGVIRIEVSRRDATAELWAMVSLTNNVTQQVTSITPQ